MDPSDMEGFPIEGGTIQYRTAAYPTGQNMVRPSETAHPTESTVNESSTTFDVPCAPPTKGLRWTVGTGPRPRTVR